MSKIHFQFLERCQGINSIYPEEAEIRNALFELSMIAIKERRLNQTENKWSRYFNDDNFRKVMRLRGKRLDHTLRPYWEWLCEYLNYICQRCHKRFPFMELTVDHIIPLSTDGLNIWDNLQPLCKRCNSSKSNRQWPISQSVRKAQKEWRKINGEMA